MAKLEWREAPASSPSRTRVQQPSAPATNNVWFGVTMGLAGVIIGYIIGML